MERVAYTENFASSLEGKFALPCLLFHIYKSVYMEIHTRKLSDFVLKRFYLFSMLWHLTNIFYFNNRIVLRCSPKFWSFFITCTNFSLSYSHCRKTGCVPASCMCLEQFTAPIWQEGFVWGSVLTLPSFLHLSNFLSPSTAVYIAFLQHVHPSPWVLARGESKNSGLIQFCRATFDAWPHRMERVEKKMPWMMRPGFG